MLEFGILEANIIIDKMSGKDFKRPNYQRLLKKLKPDDTFVIQSIDRLGRNYEEIQNQWRVITKDIGTDIVVLDMPLLDTRQKEKDLTGQFIADIVLQILSYVAETERSYCRQRQAEGIAAAQARGIKFGRPPREKPAEFVAVYETWVRKEISARAAALKLGVTHRTFRLWANQHSATVTG